MTVIHAKTEAARYFTDNRRKIIKLKKKLLFIFSLFTRPTEIHRHFSVPQFDLG